jgi:4-hydroxybenzoate polyprenyltransferase
MQHPKMNKGTPKELPLPDPDARVRAFLAGSAVLLALVSLILYGMTKEPALLISSGFAGIAIMAVYCHYFRKQS